MQPYYYHVPKDTICEKVTRNWVLTLPHLLVKGDEPVKVQITPKEFAEKMKEIFKGDYDVENAHKDGDYLMCEVLRSLGYEKGVKIFKNAEKYYF